jgi:hypothetical protein
MASAGLPPADAPSVDAASPDDYGDELRRALAAAEALLLPACARATPSAVAALGDTSALLQRMDALSAALDGARAALAGQLPASIEGGGVSRQRPSINISSLPHALIVRVLSALPADARLRCAEVCKAWLAAVCDRTLWLRVDLSPGSGVTHAVNDALLRAVAARAGGQIQALALPVPYLNLFTDEALFAVLQANPDAIRELDVTSSCSSDAVYFFAGLVKEVLDAAPQLQVFRANVVASLSEAARLLRNEAPFEPLRVRLLNVAKKDEDEDEDEEERIDDADLLALAAAMRQHVSLETVWLQDVPLGTPAVLDAFVDASLARCFSKLSLERCSLSPASAPALTRLLGSAALTDLWIVNEEMQLLDVPASTLLAGALGANTTLRVLKLDRVDLFGDVTTGAAVVRALTAHPSLQVLWLLDNEPATVFDAAAAGAALGAIVAANAPTLQELRVSWCALGDAGLAPLCDALAANTHLVRTLHCENNAMSAAFARDAFLPAIRANGSLRELVASELWGGEEDGAAPEEVLQAEALVNIRARAEAVPI